jgi:hypothetical protein
MAEERKDRPSRNEARSGEGERIFARLKDHPVYLLTAAIGLFVVGFSTFLGSISSIKAWFIPKSEPAIIEIATVNPTGPANPPRLSITMINHSTSDVVARGVRWVPIRHDVFILMSFDYPVTSDEARREMARPEPTRPSAPSGGKQTRRTLLEHEKGCPSFYKEFSPPRILVAGRASAQVIVAEGRGEPGLHCVYGVSFNTSVGWTNSVRVEIVHLPAPKIRVHRDGSRTTTYDEQIERTPDPDNGLVIYAPLAPEIASGTR